MKNEALKTIKTEFSEELKSDKIYQHIARDIRRMFNDIPHDLKYISQSDDNHKALFSSRLKAIDDEYLFHIDHYDKAIDVIRTKNEAEINKINKIRISQLDKITKRYNQQADDINRRQEIVENEYREALKDYEMTYQRDIGSYQKVAQNARKLNQKVTLEIEKEQQEALFGLKKTFDALTKTRETKRESVIKVYEEKNKEIDERQSITTTSNNDIYLNIKTDYNQFSMLFNKKINELNKENQKALKTIKERFETKRKPIDLQLAKLKEDYRAAIDRVKISYQEELVRMNADFDEKKAAYEEKKARIIHESNELVSLLNSKLTAYKEAINRENLASAKELRSKMKTTSDEHEQIEYQKTLRLNLKTANAELNRQILRTNKEISTKQRDFHYRLYSHDLSYLKTINDWRLQKRLATYRHKQSLAKIDLNFNHNISQSKIQLQLIENIHKHQEQLLNLSLNSDLLALETQLQIASLVQERELNLLTNDQQVAINSTKLEHAKLEYEQQLALEDLDFAQKQDELSYKYNQLTVSSNTQLELEKARSARDFALEEQQIRSDIAKKILERQVHLLENEKQTKLLSLNHEMKDLQTTHDNEAFQIDMKQHMLAHKRASFIMLAEIKNQRRFSLSNIKKLRLSCDEMLLDDQYYIIQFTKYLTKLHEKRLMMRQLINQLYLLPSHPETFKKALSYAMRFDHEIDQIMHAYIDDFELKSRQNFKTKMEHQDKYHHVLLYNEMMKFYEAKIKRLNREQKDIESEIQHIEQNYIKFQSKIDQNKAFIDQLNKINDQIKSGALPKQSSFDYKENIKLIKNHQTIITHLKDNMRRSDRLINMKRHEINQLVKSRTAVQKHIESATKKLTREKALESQFYLKHLVKHDKHYKVLSKKLSLFTQHSLSFYSDLKDLVYVTNDALKDATKKLKTHRYQFEKILITTEQRLLQDALVYYQEKQSMFSQFGNEISDKANTYLDQIAEMIHIFERDQKNSKNLQDTLLQKQQHASQRDESHQIEILAINKEKTKHEDLNAVKQLEEHLDIHLVHSDQEMNALNENQRSIAMQYVKEVEQKMDSFEKEHQKHMNFFKTRYMNIINDLDSSNLTLSNKNQLLLGRYLTQYAKTIETMKNKRSHYENQIDHHLLDIKKLKTTYEKDAQLKDRQRQDELRNIQHHLKKYEVQATFEQKGTLNKEASSLKRNLSFKLKALKLN